VSTILKALQRLEDEKVADTKRTLDEQILDRRSPPRPPRRRGLGIGIAAIGGLAVVAAAFLLWPSREDSDAVVATESPTLAAPPATAAAPKPAPPVARAKPRRQPPPRTAAAAPEQEDPAETQIVEVVERLDAQPAASPKRVAPSAEANRSAERPGVRKPNTQVARQPDTQAARKSEPQIADKPAQPQPAAEPVSDARSAAIQRAEPPVASVVGGSVSAKTAPTAPIEIEAVAAEPAPIRAPEQKVIQRAKVPTLRVEKTIWHPDANRRIAIVKLVGTEEVMRLKEGDAIGPLVVESIKPGSVVFNHDGIEVSYNVGG
jgi:hypothetical protein